MSAPWETDIAVREALQDKAPPRGKVMVTCPSCEGTGLPEAGHHPSSCAVAPRCGLCHGQCAVEICTRREYVGALAWAAWIESRDEDSLVFGSTEAEAIDGMIERWS